jgi:hypothetical protein
MFFMNEPCFPGGEEVLSESKEELLCRLWKELCTPTPDASVGVA